MSSPFLWFAVNNMHWIWFEWNFVTEITDFSGIDINKSKKMPFTSLEHWKASSEIMISILSIVPINNLQSIHSTKCLFIRCHFLIWRIMRILPRTMQNEKTVTTNQNPLFIVLPSQKDNATVRIDRNFSLLLHGSTDRTRYLSRMVFESISSYSRFFWSFCFVEFVFSFFLCSNINNAKHDPDLDESMMVWL